MEKLFPVVLCDDAHVVGKVLRKQVPPFLLIGQDLSMVVQEKRAFEFGHLNGIYLDIWSMEPAQISEKNANSDI